MFRIDQYIREKFEQNIVTKMLANMTNCGKYVVHDKKDLYTKQSFLLDSNDH